MALQTPPGARPNRDDGGPPTKSRVGRMRLVVTPVPDGWSPRSRQALDRIRLTGELDSWRPPAGGLHLVVGQTERSRTTLATSRARRVRKPGRWDASPTTMIASAVHRNVRGRMWSVKVNRSESKDAMKTTAT